jgi:hypothetical protein
MKASKFSDAQKAFILRQAMMLLGFTGLGFVGYCKAKRNVLLAA